MNKKIVVAGHICVDITPIFPGGYHRELSGILQPGKMIHMENIVVCTGGVVSNTGLALKKIGADVRLVGMIGNDETGRFLRDTYAHYGVERDLITDNRTYTPYTIVIAPPGVDRIFLHGPGANDCFAADDLNPDVIADAALVHFGYPPLMKRMYENGGEELVKLCRQIHRCGAAVSLDFAAIDPDSEEGHADWKQILAAVLPFVDFFEPSVEELCFMLDRERHMDWIMRSAGGDVTEILDPERDIRPLADEAMALGTKVLMLKCGAPGIWYQTADEMMLHAISERVGLDTAVWANRTGFVKGFVPERVLSGTGAGDSGIAAFLYSMLDGLPPDQCVELAAAEGASSVETVNSLNGVRTPEELFRRMKAGWLRVER